MIFLSLQSSSKCVSVSLHSQEVLLNYKRTNIIKKKQSESLMTLLENLFSEVKIKHIDKIYISRGPGSYTSLRALMSIAKGISLAFNAKIETITTFEAFIPNNSKKCEYILIFFKENRPEFHFQIFKVFPVPFDLGRVRH